MKRIVAITLTSLFLTACATTQPPQTGLAKPVQIPELPEAMSIKAERLPDITDMTLGGLIRDGVQTDKQYNSVASQLNRLIDLYNCVRISVNTGKDPKDVCLK